MTRRRMKERETELRLRHFAKTVSEIVMFAGFIALGYAGMAVLAEFLPYAEAASIGLIGAGLTLAGAAALDLIDRWRVK